MKKINNWLIWSGILIFAQSLIINKIQVYGFLNPYIYVSVFLIVPTSIGKIPLLLIGALVGGFMDLILLTGGIHLMASTLTCFFQPKILGSRHVLSISHIFLFERGVCHFVNAVIVKCIKAVSEP